ncbi:unnamed protein product [Urochloa decumbens]|uniref:Dirigent protein n=1 Tax=Urochloa decumbens TaxID=240449 RepID=A0ABC9CUA0_9POAL
MASSSHIPSLFFLLLAASTLGAVLTAAAAADGLTHIHVYVHETLAGANATAKLAVVPSPLGATASFGRIGVVDDDLRAGRDRSSQLLGWYQALIVGTSLNAGAGTLSVEGPLPGFTTGTSIERAVVGGTGRYRLARGYSLTRILGNPTPVTVLFEVDLYLLMHSAGEN